MRDTNEKFYKNLPQSPGVYLMKDRAGHVLYVGKAANLRRRVASYFMRAQDGRIEKLVRAIAKIDHKKTDSALEALILEAELIKTLQPPFNIREKDNKSFLYIGITKEKYPRVLLVRGSDVKRQMSDVKYTYGPFTSASSVREAMKILRRIFPWNSHGESEIGKAKRPCFNFEVGLCPGTCVGDISRADYMKNISRLKLFLGGKKKRLASELEREMRSASKTLDFERAAKLRKQIFALQHIRDTALVFDEKSQITNHKLQAARRIEGYDISNISGTSAVGSMVVFINGEPDINEYRKFKIRTIRQPDDVGMLREVLRRRFSRYSDGRVRIAGDRRAEARYSDAWPLPDLVLIDGGRGQVNAAKEEIRAAGLELPVVGIAKGPKRKKNEFIGKIPEWANKRTLIRVRDEAHRFALSYHRKLRSLAR
ncbi:MAG: excinuclease ABC subunit UvrC [Patescibacteria group bacterium]